MLLQNLRLIDGLGGVHQGVDVRIRDGRFAEIGRGLSPGDDRALDLKGATAVPGLIDAHTHLSLDATPEAMRNATSQSHPYQALLAANRAAALLAQGVTTARDVGGVGPVIFALRDAVAAGHVPGPRILAAGRWITVTGGHGWPIGVEADGADALRRAVRLEMKEGANLIKLMVSGGVVGPGLGPHAVQFNREEVAVAVTEAHGAGLRVAAHAHGEGSIRNAVLGGVDTVEHGAYLTEELAQEMLRRGTFLVPTLAVIQCLLEHAEEAGIRGHTAERAHQLGEDHRRNVAMAHRLGVPLVAGTDMGTPYTGVDAIHREIKELAAVGLTPMEAIQAATSTAARAIGLEQEVGSVQPGRRADLVVLDGDPLADLDATRSVRLVLKDGRFVTPLEA